jgi:hypothetical protein
MSDVALKFGRDHRSTTASVEMGVVTCDSCSARFTITHEAQHHDSDVAERQATWLERRLIQDHENGLEHEDAIDLPGYSRG